MHLFVGGRARRRGRPLGRFPSPVYPLYRCRASSTTVAHSLCLALKSFVSIFCALLKINIVFDVSGSSVALTSPQSGSNLEKCRNGEINNDKKKCTICQANIYSTQMLPTRAFVFHQCQSNHGTVSQASVITLGKKE